MKNVAILLSGRGSNFLALSDAVEAGEIDARITLVLSNRPDAPGLKHAEERNYKFACISSEGRKRKEFDRQVVQELRSADVHVICLAGFMRLLSPWLVRQYQHRILNVHPSLLPAFPGLHAQHQALDWGVKVTGCTVHFVDEELDHGPIILQHPVSILDEDTEETLSDRILRHEHRIYPQALKLLCEEQIEIRGRRVLLNPSDRSD